MKQFILAIIFLVGFCLNALTQPPCNSFVPPIKQAKTAPTDGQGNYFACESGAVDIAFTQDALPEGNQPDNLYVIEFSNKRPLIANKTGTWNTVEQGLVAGDTVFITGLTFNIDSVNGILDRAEGLCPLLNLIYPACKDIRRITEGENDGMPGVQGLDEVIEVAEILAEEKLIQLSDATSVLRKFNNNIGRFGAQICFAHTSPRLRVYIQEDGATCLQGDIDQDLISNLKEDINENGDITDDDSDGDGIPNYLDADDNNDGTLTIDQDLNNNGDPTDDDGNGDGVPDYLEQVEVSIDNYQTNFSIFPNPNSGVFEMNNPKPTDEISIFSIEGKQIRFEMNDNKILINQAAGGVYLLKVGEQTRKVLIQ